MFKFGHIWDKKVHNTKIREYETVVKEEILKLEMYV